MIARFFKDESGATAIEYGLIAAATGLALVAVMPSIKSSLKFLRKTPWARQKVEALFVQLHRRG